MKPPEEFNKFRIRDGAMATTDEAGPNGAFLIEHGDGKIALIVTAGCNQGWEHVCVKKMVKPFLGDPKQAEPTTADMQTVKAVFFRPEENCVEYFAHSQSSLHPAKNTRHLWRHAIRNFPMPETERKVPRDNNRIIKPVSGGADLEAN